MLKKVFNSYLSWFFTAYKFNTNQLGFYRILFISSLFLFNGIPQFTKIISLFPDGFFNPPPFFSLFFNDIPPITYFQISDSLIYIGLISVLVGFCTKIAGIITSILIVISCGFLYSTGKIDHGFMIWFGLFIFSFTGWENSFSIDSIISNKKIKTVNNWPISLYSMALGFAFFTAGFIKFVSGWLSPNEAMLRGFFLRNFYVQHKQDYLASYFENFNFYPFWETGDWFTILFEMLFLVSIFWVANFRFFTLLAVSFHGAVLLLFNIAFSSYMIIYVLFWIPLIPSNFWNKLNNFKVNWFILSGLVVFLLFIHYIILITNTFSVIKHIYLLSFFCLSLFILVFKPNLIFRDTNLINNKKAIIKFDGVCNLCNSFVQFVIKRDRRNLFKFKPLQEDSTSETTSTETNFSTIILQKESKTYDKSTAFANIVRELKGGWSYLYLITMIPKPIRNFVYNIIAKNRYKMFGKRDSCMIPTNDLQDKFL